MQTSAMRKIETDATPETIQWLEDFASFVRDRDFDRARLMFTSDAVGFGTIAETAVGLDRLVDRQWRPVWNATRDFSFNLETAHQGGEGSFFWAGAQWSSFGRNSKGHEMERRGRATFVFVRHHNRLLAVHSHFSFVPSGSITPSDEDASNGKPSGKNGNPDRRS